MFIAGGIIDPTFFSAGMLAGIGVSAITAIFYIGFGILFGSLCNEKSVGGISSIIITGQSVLSGMWFPLEGLSEGFLTIMRILPFKNCSDLIASAVNGFSSPWSDFYLPLLIVAIYTAVLYPVTAFTFKYKMKSR